MEKKMSKSDPSDQSRINLTDSDDQIRKKIQRQEQILCLFRKTLNDLENRPEVENLINIYSAIGENSSEKIMQDYQEMISKILNKIYVIY